jgi:hypothetical protein
MAVVLIVAFTTPIAFLWHNLIGAVVVVAVGMAISAFDREGRAQEPGRESELLTR